MYSTHTRTRTRTRTHTRTPTHTFNDPLSRTTWVSQYQKGINQSGILLKQETVSGSGISWAMCKSAPRYRQITMPAPHHSVFYRPDALPAAEPTVSKHWRQKTMYFTIYLTQTVQVNCNKIQSTFGDMRHRTISSRVMLPVQEIGYLMYWQQ